MKQYRPVYYKNFKCTADKCSDNCCIGWEIDIDENSLRKYRAVPGEFGKKLNSNITENDGAHCFVLKDERCAFLNDNNLCEIYINLGEDALCEICTQHPRYHEWYGDIKESGVGLCCEAAGRLIFSSDDIDAFEWADIDETADDFEEADRYISLFRLRQTAFELVKNGQYEQLVPFGILLQKYIDSGDFEAPDCIDFSICAKEIPQELNLDLNGEYLKDILIFLSSLEPIDPDYPNILRDIGNNLSLLLPLLPELQNKYPHFDKNLKQLAVYFIFRYFCKSIFDGDVFSKTVLPIIACNVITLLALNRFYCNKSFGTEDFVFISKQFSKEIEYCTDNLEALYDYIWDNFKTIE